MSITLKQGSRRLAGQKLQQQQQQQQQQTPQQAPVVSAPPSISDLEAKRDDVQGMLFKVEKQVCDLESKYVRSANPLGTAVTGYEGFLTGLAVPEQDMHIFSRSSVSAPLPTVTPPEVPVESAAATAEVSAPSTLTTTIQPTSTKPNAAAVNPDLPDRSADRLELTAPDTMATRGGNAAEAPAVASLPPQTDTALLPLPPSAA